MERSESISKISPALLRAQKKIGAATKGAKNPFFKSNYADLGSVMEACKDALNEEGISVLQPIDADASGEYVTTMLLHESGEFISGKMKLLIPKNMQDYGSASTYARRYGLQSMVFIPAEDDDGEKSMGRQKSAIKYGNVNIPQSEFDNAKRVTPLASKQVTPEELNTKVQNLADAVVDAGAKLTSGLEKPSFKRKPTSTVKEVVEEVKSDTGGWE